MTQINQKKLFALLFLFICMTQGLSAQEKNSSNEAAKTETKRLTDLLNKLEGTYQMQLINTREKPVLPLNLLDSVVAKRHLNDVVYFWTNDHTRFKILPFSVINSTDFKPLERTKYLESSDLK